jgi:hypothetical protein
VRLLADAPRPILNDDGDAKSEGGVMLILWSTVSISFVVAALGVAAFAMYRFFGGGHTPQH